MKGMKLQIFGSQESPGNTKKTINKHVIVKLPKEKNQEAFMKEGIDQEPLHSRCNKEIDSYLFKVISGIRRQLNDIRNDLKGRLGIRLREQKT